MGKHLRPEDLPLFVLSYLLLLIFHYRRQLLRRLVWAVAVLVRRDEHPADTDEWLERTFGIEPELEGMPDSGLKHIVADVLGMTAPEPEPSKPNLLDTVDLPEPESSFMKGFGWTRVAKWSDEDTGNFANDR